MNVDTSACGHSSLRRNFTEMLATLFLHPDRTVVARWRMGDVPTLLDLRLADEIDLDRDTALPASVREAIGDASSVRLALPTSATVLHRYPVEPEEDVDERRAFEIATCLPGIEHDRDLVLDMPLPWLVNGATWHALTVVPAEVRDRVHAMFDDHHVERACVALAAEAHAAMMARFVSGTTLLIGRRLDRWETIGMDGDGTIGSVFLRHDEARMDASVIVRDIVLDVRATSGRAVDRCVIYGDGLTRGEFDDIVRATQDLVGGVQRCNPFRAVAADTNDEVKSTCIRLAHVIAPIVGLLSSDRPVLSVDDLCASSVDA